MLPFKEHLFLHTCGAYSSPQLIYSLSCNDYYERGHGTMSHLKLVEIIILGAAALLAAAKSVIKFLDYVGKLNVGFATIAT